jgi:hypothetical protein
MAPKLPNGALERSVTVLSARVIGMRYQRVIAILFGALATGLSVRGGCETEGKDTQVLPLSEELVRQTQPWCPKNCKDAISFVATYERGNEKLVFVGVRHAYDPNSPTMRAVAEGCSRITPAVVILESFPTTMGENPPQLVEVAQRYGTAEAEGFARGEAFYAASLALARGIPFLGGEPTQEEQLDGLRAEGFTDADIAFDAVLGWIAQSLGNKEVPDTSLVSLNSIYPELVEVVRDQTGLEAPSIEELRRRYKDLYGVDLIGDPDFARRINIGDTPARARIRAARTLIRDRHILSVIEKQLSQRHAVMVIYGAAHWSTLSAALEARLGKPEIMPFPH